MYPTSVWAFQVSLAIKRNGKTYTFQKPQLKDQFGQPVTEELLRAPVPLTTVEVPGIFHADTRWTNSKVTSEESSNMNQRLPETAILCEKEAAKDLCWGMTVVVAGKTYRLIKARDIEGMELFCDLILEEVQGSGL